MHLLLLRGFKRLLDFFLCKQKSQEPVLTQERAELSLCQTCRAPGMGVLGGRGQNHGSQDPFSTSCQEGGRDLAADGGLRNQSRGKRFQLGSVFQLKFSPREAEIMKHVR